MNDQNNSNFFDLISILSFAVGMENLQENRSQSAHNDVQIANDKQAAYLLEKINQRFDEQNKILAEQNEILDNLVEMMEKQEVGNNGLQ